MTRANKPVYVAVRAANQADELERGFGYSSKVSGFESVHYDEACLVGYVATVVCGNPDSKVILRVSLAKNDVVARLLEAIVQNHNLVIDLSVSQLKGEARARKELDRLKSV